MRSSDPDEALAEALVRIEGRDLSTALRHLLVAWSQRRDSRVGDAIARIERLLGGRALKDGADLHDRWCAIEARGDPADSARLARALPLGDPTGTQLKHRVDALLRRDPHPGVFRTLMGDLAALPPNLFGEGIEALLLHHADPSQPIGWVSHDDHPGAGAWNRRLVRVEAHLPELDSGPMKGSHRLWSALRASQREERSIDPLLVDLWAKVSATPEDDVPRWIFADRVHATDANWSAFIQLQLHAETRDLTAEEERRVRHALRNPIAWLGPLGRHVEPKGIRMRRGFLDTVNVRPSWRQRATEIGALHHWGTVTALWSKQPQIFLGRGLANLESAGTRVVRHLRDGRWVPHPGGRAITGSQLVDLARGGPWPWRVLQIRAHDSDAEALVESLPSLRAPRLVCVVVDGTHVSEEIFAALPAIRELVLRQGGPPLDTLLWHCRTLEVLTVVGCYTLVRDGRRWELRFIDPEPAERKWLIDDVLDSDRRELLAESLQAVLSKRGETLSWGPGG